MPVRRALCIGVSGFADPGWSALPDAADDAARLAEVLGALGYDCDALGGEAATTEAIGAAFYRAVEELGPDDLLVVTVLSHGDLAVETGELYVVGSDGARHRAGRVGDWIKEVEDLDGRPRALFLLDLCQAGVVARAPHLLAPGSGPRRSWVLAACPPDRAAYDGRFTEAVTNVLAAFADGERELHPAQPFLPLTTLAADIKRELDRLVDAVDAYPQEAIGGLIDLTEADESPPFFANPAFRSDPLREVRRESDASVGAFLDEVDALADPGHYVAKASGHGLQEDRLRSGCFTGRAGVLRTLSRWLDGLESGALRVVTGSPGTGKSALLGILVCAAHPRLRPHTERIWFRAAHTPSENEALVVVHARQRDEAEVLASIARQLGLGSVRDWAELRRALPGRAETPVLIVDALDEALRPEALAEHLLALTNSGCRLLAGLRRWPEFDRLFAAASEDGVVDLDGVPRAEVRAEIGEYVEAMLALSTPYGSRRFARAREAFAAAVGATLAEPTGEPGRRWGGFLVAALFVHRVLSRQALTADPDEAERIGRQVPGTLPEVVELDLTEAPELRPLLRTLAMGRGEGMPLEVVRSLAPLFGAAAAAPDLERARFYLRQSADSDGTTLYRLFHQGLADHLRQPGREGEVLDLLLPATWESALPYVKRHAIQYAAAAGRVDELLRAPGFLVNADPRTLEPELAAARADDTELLAAIYRASAARHRACGVPGRRRVLGVDAVRYGAPDVAAALSDGFPWRPRWASGGQVASALRRTFRVSDGAVHALAAGETGGRAVVVAAVEGGPPGVWDPVTGTPVRDRLGTATATAVACTRVGGRAAAVTGDPLGALRVFDLADGRPLGPVLTGHTYEIVDIACLATGDRSFAVTASEDGAVLAWDLAASAVLPVPGDVTGRSVACAELDGSAVAAVVVGDRSLVLWDVATGREVARRDVAETPCEISVGRVGLNGHHALLVACRAGVWLLDGSAPGEPMRSLPAPPVESPRVSGGTDAAVVGDDGTVCLLGIGAGEHTVASLAHGSPLTAVACFGASGRGARAVTGDADGDLRVWDMDDPLRTGRPRPAHHSWIGGLATTGELVLSADQDDRVLLHHLGSGERIGDLPARGEFLALWGAGPVLALFRDPEDRRRVRVWELDARTEHEPGVPLVAAEPVTALTTLRVGHLDVVVLGDAGGGLEIIDQRGRALRQWRPGRGDDPIVRLERCPGVSDRGIVASLSSSGRVRVWDLASAREDGFDVGAGTEAAAIACARVRRRPLLLTGLADGRVCRWDVLTGEPGGPPLPGTGAPVTALACGRANGRGIAVAASQDAVLRIWDLDAGVPIDTVALPQPAQRLCVSPSGAVVAAMNWEIVVLGENPAGVA
ncbi:caspase family protein [Spirillospora sp. CA-294931]|uniref:caspase family protein n=1 Tax=Spirillospora sp. CA-294931 TaxID=3240042 RepID=UPI003D8EA1E6